MRFTIFCCLCLATMCSVAFARNPKHSQCTPKYTRCAGAEGKPFVQYAPCCDKGFSCVERKHAGGDNWGRFCLPYGHPSASQPHMCYKKGERCMGAPGKQYVAPLSCCGHNKCVIDKARGWGAFCNPDGEQTSYDKIEASYYSGSDENGVHSPKMPDSPDADQAEYDTSTSKPPTSEKPTYHQKSEGGSYSPYAPPKSHHDNNSPHYDPAGDRSSASGSSSTSAESYGSAHSDTQHNQENKNYGESGSNPAPEYHRSDSTDGKAVPKCYGASDLCMGAPGMPYVPYRGCCDMEFSCKPYGDGRVDLGCRCQRNSYTDGYSVYPSPSPNPYKHAPRNSNPSGHPTTSAPQYATHSNEYYHNSNPNYGYQHPTSQAPTHGKTPNPYGYQHPTSQAPAHGKTPNPFGYQHPSSQAPTQGKTPNPYHTSKRTYPPYHHSTPTHVYSSKSQSHFTTKAVYGTQQVTTRVLTTHATATHTKTSPTGLFCKAGPTVPRAVNVIRFAPLSSAIDDMTVQLTISRTPCGESNLGRNDLSADAARELISVARRVAAPFSPSNCAINSIDTGSIVVVMTIPRVGRRNFQAILRLLRLALSFLDIIIIDIFGPASPTPSPTTSPAPSSPPPSPSPAM
jgi:hypothetical protein